MTQQTLTQKIWKPIVAIGTLVSGAWLINSLQVDPNFVSQSRYKIENPTPVVHKLSSNPKSALESRGIRYAIAPRIGFDYYSNADGYQATFYDNSFSPALRVQTKDDLFDGLDYILSGNSTVATGLKAEKQFGEEIKRKKIEQFTRVYNEAKNWLDVYRDDEQLASAADAPTLVLDTDSQGNLSEICYRHVAGRVNVLIDGYSLKGNKSAINPDLEFFQPLVDYRNQIGKEKRHLAEQKRVLENRQNAKKAKEEESHNLELFKRFLGEKK
ncbi:MAG: hypothetical protein ABIJ08_04045 [Nanoarchaeota archaeon]